jgi:hypothetical protein
MKIQNQLNVLTLEKLRSYPGLGNLTNEEAREAIDAIVKLSFLVIKKALEEKSEDTITSKNIITNILICPNNSFQEFV